jgi:hypothetical protein
MTDIFFLLSVGTGMRGRLLISLLPLLCLYLCPALACCHVRVEFESLSPTPRSSCDGVRWFTWRMLAASSSSSSENRVRVEGQSELRT